MNRRRTIKAKAALAAAALLIILQMLAGCVSGGGSDATSESAVQTTDALPEATTAETTEATEPEATTAETPVTTVPEATTVEEPVTTQPEATTAEPPVTTEPEVTTAEPPVTTQPEATTAEPPVTTHPEVTTTAPPVTTQPEVTTAAPPVTTQPEATTAAPPVTTQPEATTAAPPVTTQPETTESGSQSTEPYQLSDDTTGFSYTQERVCEDYSPLVMISYASFFASASDTGITMPALNQNFVPQGIDYWEKADVFLISGYFNPSSTSSVILAVRKSDGKYVGEWSLKNKSGSWHTAHDGGIAVTETDIYLANSSKLFRIPLSQIVQTGNHGTLKIEQEISVPVRASYCNYSCGYLWVGEFSIYGNSSYTITGHEFGENYAWTVGYRLGSDGRPESKPSVVISTPERIQGFCMLDDGRLFMTRSYGRTSDSYFYITTEKPLTRAADGSVTISGKSVPLYEVNQNVNCRSVKVVPMAEGCTCIGNTAYVIFESAAYYYRAATPTSVSKNPTDRIWSFTN